MEYLLNSDKYLFNMYCVEDFIFRRGYIFPIKFLVETAELLRVAGITGFIVTLLLCKRRGSRRNSKN